MSPAPARQPWPMKWVIIAVIAVIVPYTYIRWHYRKPGHAFEPYHDIKDRANTLRLLSAGFQRVALEADRLAEPVAGLPKGGSFPAPGGLPESLAASLVDTPLLPLEIVSVAAASNATGMFSYPIQFTCTLADHSQQFSAAQLYVRSEEIIIVPALEKLTGLESRTRETLIRLTVPAGTLKPGHYRVTLIGARMSRAWTLEVQ